MKIGIIGGGHVGGTLGCAWVKAGHEVMFGVRDPAAPTVQELLAKAGVGAKAATISEAAAFGEVVVLAVPWSAAQETIQSAGDLTGKVVFDCMNPVKQDFSWLESMPNSSAGEQVASWVTGAGVVKIFNTAGFGIMANPYFGEQNATMFYCGDNTEAKPIAAQLASDIGFDPIDVGPMEQARLLEAAAWLWITMALKYGQGTDIAFKLLRR